MQNILIFTNKQFESRTPPVDDVIPSASWEWASSSLYQHSLDLSISRQDYGCVVHHSAIKYGFLKMNNRSSQKHLPLINNLKTLFIQYVIKKKSVSVWKPTVVHLCVFVMLSYECGVLCSGGVFLASVGSAGVIAGFGSTLAMAKKKSPEWFSKVSGFLQYRRNWKHFLQFSTRMPCESEKIGMTYISVGKCYYCCYQE